jgi:hypothetical protein
MTLSFIPLRRLAALSVAITLFTAPIAAAQSPETAPPSAAPPNTALLSNAAFARLIQQPRTEVARTRTLNSPPRIELRRPVTAPAARRAPAAYTMAPQGSWASRHKVALTWIIIGGVFFGVVVPILNGIATGHYGY